jgi:hypothetical protein
MTHRFTPTLFLASVIFAFPGQDLFGTYSYKDNAHALKYIIRSDSTFAYYWSDGCQGVTIQGRWTIHLDTMILTGSRKDLSKDRIKLLEGIIDTKLLIRQDGLYTLGDKKFIKSN